LIGIGKGDDEDGVSFVVTSGATGIGAILGATLQRGIESFQKLRIIPLDICYE